jgi:putative hydrolase of the HAD superfamily
LNRRFAAVWSARVAFDYSEGAWAQIVDATFAGLVDAPPSRTFFSPLYRQFGTAAAWRLYEDAPPVLVALRNRGLKLAIISNWDDRLPGLLQQLDLTKYFDHLVCSYAVGATKPAPAIFQSARERLGLSFDQILHVGDSYREDFQGARAAGMPALLLRRRAEGGVPGQIQSLGELLASR